MLIFFACKCAHIGMDDHAGKHVYAGKCKLVHVSVSMLLALGCEGVGMLMWMGIDNMLYWLIVYECFGHWTCGMCI